MTKERPATKITFRGAIVRGLQALSRTAGALSARLEPPDAAAKLSARIPRWKELWFVADIPLFIDETAVRQLFDALVRPEFEATGKRVSQGESRSHETGGHAGTEIGSGVPGFLAWKGNAEISHKESKEKQTSDERTFEVNRSAEMHLERIIHLYVHQWPHRIFWARSDSTDLIGLDGSPSTWPTVGGLFDEPGPRPLVILDLVPGAKLIPMAGESHGKVSRIYQDLISALDPKSEELTLNYPASENSDQAKKYWSALDKQFNPIVAMTVVENSTLPGERLDWIDFRVLQREKTDFVPLHLHLSPRGRYPTGTFAYQTIRRAFKEGLMVVGTLKRGEDINVLSMYEK